MRESGYESEPPLARHLLLIDRTPGSTHILMYGISPPPSISRFGPPASHQDRHEREKRPPTAFGRSYHGETHGPLRSQGLFGEN